MTERQAEELARAIHRARDRGLEVVGHGRRRYDGARIYAVPSQIERGRWHLVAVEGQRLSCDCQARVICVHRAAVYLRLVREHNLSNSPAEHIVAERSATTTMPETTLYRTLHETAPLYRSNGPVTMWK